MPHTVGELRAKGAVHAVWCGVHSAGESRFGNLHQVCQCRTVVLLCNLVTCCCWTSLSSPIMARFSHCRLRHSGWFWLAEPSLPAMEVNLMGKGCADLVAQAGTIQPTTGGGQPHAATLACPDVTFHLPSRTRWTRIGAKKATKGSKST